MMDIAIRVAARPGQRRLVLLWAVMAGVAAGLVIGLAARVPGRIPADALVVTVTPVSGFGSGPSRGEPDDAFTITDPATVAKIAAVIDGLRQLPDGTHSCPAEAGSAIMLTSMQLTFRTAPRRLGGSHSGRRLYHAVLPIAAAVAGISGKRSPHAPCASWRPRAVRRFVAQTASDMPDPP
jgi:hypothetical protein